MAGAGQRIVSHRITLPRWLEKERGKTRETKDKKHRFGERKEFCHIQDNCKVSESEWKRNFIQLGQAKLIIISHQTNEVASVNKQQTLRKRRKEGRRKERGRMRHLAAVSTSFFHRRCASEYREKRKTSWRVNESDYCSVSCHNPAGSCWFRAIRLRILHRLKRSKSNCGPCCWPARYANGADWRWIGIDCGSRIANRREPLCTAHLGTVRHEFHGNSCGIRSVSSTNAKN